MGNEAVEITCHINNTFGSGVSKGHTVQWGFKGFCLKEEALKKRS